jgi:Protein of unknown function (DUF1778)
MLGLTAGRPKIDRRRALQRGSACAPTHHRLGRNEKRTHSLLREMMTPMPSDADYYEQHKDDEQDWGEPIQSQQPRRRLAAMISVRFSPDEQTWIRDAASARGESLSHFVRMAALQRAGIVFPLYNSVTGHVAAMKSTTTPQSITSTPTPEKTSEQSLQLHSTG